MMAFIDEVIVWFDGEFGCPPHHEAQLRALDRAQWRRVRDGIPEDGARVLVMVENDPHPQIATVDGESVANWGVESYAEWAFDGNTITHWRLLPEGPGDG